MLYGVVFIAVTPKRALFVVPAYQSCSIVFIHIHVANVFVVFFIVDVIRTGFTHAHDRLLPLTLDSLVVGEDVADQVVDLAAFAIAEGLHQQIVQGQFIVAVDDCFVDGRVVGGRKILSF